MREERVALRQPEVLAHHLGDELLERDARRPAELGPRLGGVAEQGLHLRGAEIARIDAYDRAPVLVEALLALAGAAPGQAHAEEPGGALDELAHAELPSGRDHVVLGR